MKVVFIAREYGGKGTWRIMNYNQALALANLGIDVLVITQSTHPNVNHAHLSVYDVGGRYRPGSVISSILFKFRMFRELRLVLGSHVVDAQYHLADGLLFAFLKSLTGRPRLVLRSVHQISIFEYSFFLGHKRESALGRLRYKISTIRLAIWFGINDLTLRLSDVGTYESDFTFRKRRRLKGPHLSPNQLGIDCRVFKYTETNKTRIKFDLMSVRYILLVAGLQYLKGLQVFVDALPCILNSKLIQKAVIVGSEREPGFHDWLFQRLDSRYRQFLTIIDHLPQTELAELYSHCAVFVSSSLYESYGFPVIEALACGAPVVATNTGIVQELKLKPPLGIIVRPGDAKELARAVIEVSSYKESVELREQRRAIVCSKYCIELWAERALKLYKICLKKSD